MHLAPPPPRVVLWAAVWLIAGLLAPRFAAAQVQELVNFVLYPDSLLQLTAEGNAEDSRTKTNGTETLTKQQGGSALLGWAPGRFAFGITAAARDFTQESAGLEIKRNEYEQGGVVALYIGLVTLVASTSRQNGEERAEDPAAGIVLDYRLNREFESEFGVLVRLGYAQLGYFRAQTRFDLKVELTGYPTIRESYAPTVQSLIAGFRVGEKKGPFLAASFVEQSGTAESGTAVDFEGLNATRYGGETGWRFAKDSSLSVNYSAGVSTIEFADTLKIRATSEGYGITMGLNESLSAGFSIQRQSRQFLLALPNVGSLSDVETRESTARIGMGLRF